MGSVDSQGELKIKQADFDRNVTTNSTWFHDLFLKYCNQDSVMLMLRETN